MVSVLILVGGTPLKNMSESQLGWHDIPNWMDPFMFHTTNQFIMLGILQVQAVPIYIPIFSPKSGMIGATFHCRMTILVPMGLETNVPGGLFSLLIPSLYPFMNPGSVLNLLFILNPLLSVW